MQNLSIELARNALDTASDAIIIIDGSGLIRFASRQVSALFGYSHDELLGNPVEYLIPERFRGQHTSLRQAYTKNARVRPMGVGLTLFARRSDGTEFPVEISLSPVDDADGMLVTAAIRDITQRKRIEAEREEQLEDIRRIHEMSTRLIAATDRTTMLEEVLDATIALQQADFGNIQLYDPETDTLKIVAHRGFSDDFVQHFASVDRNEPSVCGRALRAGERLIIEDVEEYSDHLPHRAIAVHEGYRGVQATPIRGRDGTVLGMLSTHFRVPHRPSDRELQLTDIYMRVVAELVARAQHEDAVQAARDAATRANRAKSRFLATASHDLRQPLHTLALLNGMLRRMPMQAAASEALAQQEQTIGSMSRLLNALLDISKLESGAIKPDPTDFPVGALFEELQEEFSGVAGNKGLIFEVIACEECAHSDPSLVGQILRNLLSNAIKYTRAGRVTLRCLCDQETGVRIEVLDTGVGMPAEQLRYIYEEFYQIGVPSNTTREGYGLGLSIVQRLVELLNLKLDVKSEVGEGSMFALTLPTGRKTERTARRLGPEPTPHARQAEARVLLVEDDAAVRAATRMLLESVGYKVTAVATKTEALTQAKANPRIDLLVTDYHLSEGETGVQVISALRAELGRSVKTVLMSGDTSSAVKDLPNDDTFRVASKPVNADELLGMLGALLGA